MPLDEFEQEKLREHFRPILEAEAGRADWLDLPQGIAKDAFLDLLDDYPHIRTAAELNDDRLRDYARKWIEECERRQK